MTNTDRVYIAVVETMKKYSIEQAIGALELYVREGNSLCFTSTNNARQVISQISPAEVMQDTLISILKYNMIVIKKGQVQGLPNLVTINKVMQSYYSGQPMAIPLTSSDLNGLVTKMLERNVGDTLNMLATYPGLLKQFLGQYASLVCNNREDLNAISNDQFIQINDYFAQLTEQRQTQR